MGTRGVRAWVLPPRWLAKKQAEAGQRSKASGRPNRIRLVHGSGDSGGGGSSSGGGGGGFRVPNRKWSGSSLDSRQVRTVGNDRGPFHGAF